VRCAFALGWGTFSTCEQGTHSPVTLQTTWFSTEPWPEFSEMSNSCVALQEEELSV
jgi:hypothetical protein